MDAATCAQLLFTLIVHNENYNEADVRQRLKEESHGEDRVIQLIITHGIKHWLRNARWKCRCGEI